MKEKILFGTDFGGSALLQSFFWARSDCLLALAEEILNLKLRNAIMFIIFTEALQTTAQTLASTRNL